MQPSMRYCLNTSTIQGQKLSLIEEIAITAKAGYHAIEPWVSEIQTYRDSGGSLPELKRRIADAGLTVENAIGFFDWIVDDPTRRAAALESAARDMELVAQIGCPRLAAPPMGATDEPGLNLRAAADRFAALCEQGDRFGITPLLEVWGFSKNLCRLSDALVIAAECGRPDAAILLDVYHLYRGGSGYAGINLLNGACLPVFHVNDFPGHIPAETVTDADRVYPGDGAAPWGEIIRSLRRVGFQGVLSVELFNRDYWAQEALIVARTAREKLQALVEANPAP